MALKKDNKIEKRNTLNEFKAGSMSLHEVRLLTIYLSKINAREPTSRLVQFSLTDFRKIMGLGRVKISAIKTATTHLLQKIVTIDSDVFFDDELRGYSQFQLFKEIALEKDKCGGWFVKIDCHDKALPLFFEFKKDYFTYELWNALRLSSPNQIRMYEILKQHQAQGSWTFELEELRDLLFLEPAQYVRFHNFKAKVLITCQQALLENTDLCFEYELVKKGVKITHIKFIINKNDRYVDQFTLSEFINSIDDGGAYDEDVIDLPHSPLQEYIDLISKACNDEFNKDEIMLLIGYLEIIVPYFKTKEDTDLARYAYFNNKYNYLNLKKPKNRFAYLKKILESEAQK